MSSTRPKSPSPRNSAASAAGRPSGAGERRRQRLLLVTVGILAVLAVAAGVIALAQGDGGREHPSAASGGAQVAHVHGLGVDPADGVLYAGTHYGLFRIPEDGQATRVADRVQDFMGFTVAGPNHYLASGHPGQGQDGPSSLGLIESTDGGQTWESLSLAGEADFHSLETRHGLVYGLDAMTGQFMVSEDKTTWERRGAVPMADFAVSPQDPDVILATTERGLARSDDGGRRYAPLADGPLVLLVAWAEDGAIVSVEPDGTLQASTDGGETWEERGELGGAPHALAAVSSEEIYAAIDGAILASDDGGRTFTARYEE